MCRRPSTGIHERWHKVLSVTLYPKFSVNDLSLTDPVADQTEMSNNGHTETLSEKFTNRVKGMNFYFVVTQLNNPVMCHVSLLKLSQ